MTDTLEIPTPLHGDVEIPTPRPRFSVGDEISTPKLNAGAEIATPRKGFAEIKTPFPADTPRDGVLARAGKKLWEAGAGIVADTATLPLTIPQNVVNKASPNMPNAESWGVRLGSKLLGSGDPQKDVEEIRQQAIGESTGNLANHPYVADWLAGNGSGDEPEFMREMKADPRLNPSKFKLHAEGWKFKRDATGNPIPVDESPDTFVNPYAKPDPAAEIRQGVKEAIGPGEIAPPRNAAEKYLVDLPINLAGTVGEIALQRKLLPADLQGKGPVQEAAAWELQNQASGGEPGHGAIMGGTVGSIGKILPNAPIKATIAEGALFGGSTYLATGNVDEAIVNALLPAAMRTPHAIGWVKGRLSSAKTPEARQAALEEVQSQATSDPRIIEAGAAVERFIPPEARSTPETAHPISEPESTPNAVSEKPKPIDSGLGASVRAPEFVPPEAGPTKFIPVEATSRSQPTVLPASANERSATADTALAANESMSSSTEGSIQSNPAVRTPEIAPDRSSPDSTVPPAEPLEESHKFSSPAAAKKWLSENTDSIQSHSSKVVSGGVDRGLTYTEVALKSGAKSNPPRQFYLDADNMPRMLTQSEADNMGARGPYSAKEVGELSSFEDADELRRHMATERKQTVAAEPPKEIAALGTLGNDPIAPPVDRGAEAAGEGPQVDRPRDPSLTSTKHEFTREDRQIMGLDAPDSPDRRSREQAAQMAMDQKIPERAGELAAEINANPRPITDIEDAGLRVRLAQLKKEYKGLKGDDPFSLAEKHRVSEEFDAITRATDIGGTESGRALGARRNVINEDMELLPILNRAKQAKGGALSPVESAKFEGMTKQLETANNRVSELEQQLNEQVAERAIRKAKTREMKPQGKELSELYGKLNSLLKAGCA